MNLSDGSNLKSDTTYLDHAGTTPFPRSLIEAFEKDMTSHLYGNPHTHSPSSELSTETVENARLQALRFFKADPDHFDLVFVANATAAIKLVADCVLDYSNSKGSSGFWYGYHGDSHTSLVGVREVAGSKATCFETDKDVEDWLHAPPKCQSEHHSGEDADSTRAQIGLFAYPAQSNMNGRRLPKDWPGQVRVNKVNARSEVYSLLDAAAYVASAQLDLSDWQNSPDFTCLSFYKIFGFPDLGALIVRKASSHVLQARRYFGGGTVDMVINGAKDTMWHSRRGKSLHESLEDGTQAFHNILALEKAFLVHETLYGSMDNVSKHTTRLIEKLYQEMFTLSHGNGLNVCQIYEGAISVYGVSVSQGPTIAFNVKDDHGNWVGMSEVQRLAIGCSIQLRTGGVCNPGGVASALQISSAKMKEHFDDGVRCGNEKDLKHGQPTGIVRVSLGAMSSDRDIERFLAFLGTFRQSSPIRAAHCQYDLNGEVIVP